ncbi:MAG TPA: DUF6152 family protein [Gammaproteobacteria bacterium]|nr:DUF6152 family protein [Gammaproteobacteria bacterium]
MRAAAIAFGVVVFMVAVAPARAHHAFATEFDVNRPVELKGKVTKIELINPHSWITLEVIGKDGKPETWMIEGGSPNALVRKGVTKASVPVGSELTVRGYGTRDGTNKAVGRDIMFADGRALFFDSSKPATGETAPTP